MACNTCCDNNYTDVANLDVTSWSSANYIIGVDVNGNFLKVTPFTSNIDFQNNQDGTRALYDDGNYYSTLKKSDVISLLNQNLIQSISFDSNGNLVLTLINISSGATSTLTVSQILATESNNGLMPKEMYKQVDENTNRLDNLVFGGKFINQTFATFAALQAFDVTTLSPAIAQGDFTYVEKDENNGNNTSMYTWSGTDWVFTFVIESAIQIATTTSIGNVMSATDDGKVFVEADGTMSLNGYDDILTKINNNINNIESNTSALSNKVDKVVGMGLSEANFTQNLSNKLTAIPSFWFGTQIAYDALGTYDQNTLYFINQ